MAETLATITPHRVGNVRSDFHSDIANRDVSRELLLVEGQHHRVRQDPGTPPLSHDASRARYSTFGQTVCNIIVRHALEVGAVDYTLAGVFGSVCCDCDGNFCFLSARFCFNGEREVGRRQRFPCLLLVDKLHLNSTVSQFFASFYFTEAVTALSTLKHLCAALGKRHKDRHSQTTSDGRRVIEHGYYQRLIVISTRL